MCDDLSGKSHIKYLNRNSNITKTTSVEENSESSGIKKQNTSVVERTDTTGKIYSRENGQNDILVSMGRHQTAGNRDPG